MFKKFVTLGPFALSNIHLVGTLEKQSIAASVLRQSVFFAFSGRKLVNQNRIVIHGLIQHTVHKDEIA